MKFALWDLKRIKWCKQWKQHLIIQIELLITYLMEFLQMLAKDLVHLLQVRNQDNQEIKEEADHQQTPQELAEALKQLDKIKED